MGCSRSPGRGEGLGEIAPIASKRLNYISCIPIANSGELALQGLQVAALIGDISHSKRIEARAELQQVLQQRLDEANRTFRPHLVSRLTITVGDEYQGVFRTPQMALMAAFAIAEALSPVRLHNGLGIGGLSTPIDAKNPGRMDGPCFHHARAALQQSRRQKSWLTVSGISQPDDELVSSTLGLWGRVRESWTGRQREVVQAVQATEDQRKAAHDLHVSPPTVTRVLKAARYHELARAKTALIAFLGKPLPTEEASP